MKNWDNPLLNINGRSKYQLKSALQAAIDQERYDEKDVTPTIKGWKFSEEHGILITTWVPEREHGYNIFTPHLDVDETVDFVWNWLRNNPDAAKVPMGDWEDDPRDSDVSVEEGFRLYVEDWGHLGNDYLALCAIKIVWLWYGK